MRTFLHLHSQPSVLVSNCVALTRLFFENLHPPSHELRRGKAEGAGESGEWGVESGERMRLSAGRETRVSQSAGRIDEST